MIRFPCEATEEEGNELEVYNLLTRAAGTISHLMHFAPNEHSKDQVALARARALLGDLYIYMGRQEPATKVAAGSGPTHQG